jgi:acyl dehydratase
MGVAIGPSAWVAITQAMIDRFGEVTLDPDPMHMDPQWARANSPFGQTIAYGFQTMSMLTHLLYSASGTVRKDDPAQFGSFINYGMERVRLINPVPAGSRIRATFVPASTRTDDRGRQIVVFGCTVDIEGADRPALVGEWVSLWLPPTPAAQT